MSCFQKKLETNKAINVSQMFTPLYYSTPKKLSPSSTIERDILKIHAPFWSQKLMKYHGNLHQKYANTNIPLPDTKYTTHWSKWNSFTQELSTTATLHCHKSTMAHPTCLHIDGLPNRFSRTCRCHLWKNNLMAYLLLLLCTPFQPESVIQRCKTTLASEMMEMSKHF